ncbi:3-ketoacyl-ACP reductase [Bacillus canaveralius]|uniref:3-ketoacyl-ACP reductase n=1 Tax=Bacillus canaveralius TaxID=1403243 RepID=A0A2N5GJJ5_9BACI|nr:glucose 1-dehydrogenase [Bacillus canaveralius]PLR81417.1 3-ketoacyl-ACP reductase [Bacillus canaveralius]PLR90044.1 3-ketoacyl-ACP reductase [Bacillus canaveralius]RSK53078.1 SDR family oxidoreductase [Bacillus canaveralius]
MTAFENKIVIVTGGSHGIGKGVATAFAEKGASVIIADVDEESGETVERALRSKHYKAHFIRTDVKNEESVRTLVNKTIEKYAAVDILINNAGISKFHSFFEMTLDDWNEVIDTNLKSVFLCSREAAKHMKESGGSIVNIASTRAFMSEPDTEAYSASKGGIIALTRSLARTLSPYRIRVNSISPGWIEVNDYEGLRDTDHEQHLSKRVGKPADIGKGCLYLADPANDFVTGENIIIDGGMTRKMIYEE